jgi:hypothetical protein
MCATASATDLLIDLSGIEELAEIKIGDNGVRVGAAFLATLAGTRRCHTLSRTDASRRDDRGPAIVRWEPSAAIYASIHAVSL